jgi:hypothetical protein
MFVICSGAFETASEILETKVRRTKFRGEKKLEWKEIARNAG